MYKLHTARYIFSVQSISSAFLWCGPFIPSKLFKALHQLLTAHSLHRTANRTLEEMDLLFASKSPWVWDEEKHFKRLKEEMARGTHIDELSEGVGACSKTSDISSCRQ